MNPKSSQFSTFEIDMEEATAAVLGAARAAAGPKLSLDPDKVEHDLARLVLTLIEFLRQLVELQAIRRLENGQLSEDEEERLGLTLMRGKDKLLEIAEKFDLKEEDLHLNLGPLGDLTKR